MKKILILGILIAFSSCNNDDDKIEEVKSAVCQDFVWGVNQNCNPIPNCTYIVSHGATEDNVTTVTVNESTYNYYRMEFESNPDLVCWEGVK